MTTKTDMGAAQAPATPTTTLPASPLALGLALFSLYIIWGSTYLAIRYALEGFPPFLMAGIRFLVAGTLMFIVLRLLGHPAPTRAGWRAAAIVGGLLLMGGNGLVVFAQQSISSSLAAVGVATMPLWAAIFAGLWGQWPVRREWIGIGLGLFGVVLLNLEGGMRASPIGALAILGATVSWAFGSIWSRRLPLPTGLMAPAAEMLAGSVLLVLVGLLSGETLPADPPAQAVAAVAYLIFFGSIVAFSAYAYLLRHARPALATSYAYVNPLVAVLLGVFLAGEELGAVGYAALVVILIGVALVTLGRARS